MSLQVIPIGRTESVPVTIENLNSKTYRFGDNVTKLDDIVLYGLSLHTNAVKKTADEVDIMLDADLKQGFITLMDRSGKSTIEKLPMETFFINQNFILFIEPRRVSLSQSTVQFPSAPTITIPAGKTKVAALFTFYYEIYNPQKHANIGDYE